MVTFLDMSNYPFAFAREFPQMFQPGHYERFIFWLSENSVVAYTCLVLIFVYYLFVYFHAPVTFALWNALVFLTPTRLVIYMDKGTPGEGIEISDLVTGTWKDRHMAKSFAMQRVFGLGSTSFFSQSPRGLSELGHAILSYRDHKPPGLGNWDNSCYQNSIIQGFASLQYLQEFLSQNLMRLGRRPIFRTHSALHEVIESLNSPENSGRRLWTPLELKSMCSWQQQDAQEYFAKVVEQMDKEVRLASRGITSNPGFKKVQLETAGSGQYGPEDHYLSSLLNPMEGLLAQRVGCIYCGWSEGLSLIPFNCLTVPLGRHWMYDIRGCLDAYTAFEKIEGVECAKCTLLRSRRQLLTLLKQIKTDGDSKDADPKLNAVFLASVQERLKAVDDTLECQDFTEKALAEKCRIPRKNRVLSVKSRQAVIARTPKSLAIHVNRSVFNELSGQLSKNYADVRFPLRLDLEDWCLGSKTKADNGCEVWGIDPSKSLLPEYGGTCDGTLSREYELRAVITHHGRHETGHYVCYRKYPIDKFPVPHPESIASSEKGSKGECWFRLSDEDVSIVSENNVLSQGGVFMLFYEMIDMASSEAYLGGEKASEEKVADKITTHGSLVGGADLSESLHSSKVLSLDTASTVDGFVSSSASELDANSSVTSYDSSTSPIDENDNKPYT